MAIVDKLTLIVRLGIVFAAVVYIADQFLLPSKKVPKSRNDLEQYRLNLQEGEVENLLNPKTGKLNLMGWEVNGEKLVQDNSEQASRALFDDPSWGSLRARGVNMHFLQTPEHYI